MKLFIMGELIQSLFGGLLTFAIVLVGVNYFLRYTFENRFLNSKSDYLISNSLVQMLILLTMAYWAVSAAGIAAIGSLLDGYDGPEKLFTAFLIFSVLGALVVTITTAMSIYHVFRRNGNVNLLKNLSYVGIALVGITTILGLILFAKFDIPKVSTICIIIFVILLAIACWFEYQYCLSVDKFFEGGQELSYQERILKLLEAQAGPVDAATFVEKKPTKFCPNCGEQIDATSEVCPVCSEKTNF